jgi:hypothetical protein
VAAVAQVPVVHPKRKDDVSVLTIGFHQQYFFFNAAKIGSLSP